MPSIRTTNFRRRRSYWRKRGVFHVHFNRGIMRRQDQEEIEAGIHLTHNGNENPGSYFYYPRGS